MKLVFFPKSGHFSLNFKKGQGRPTPYPPLVTCLHIEASTLIYGLVFAWHGLPHERANLTYDL